MFIERISNAPRRILPTDQNVAFTDREAEVLKMLVEGRSNKEIGTPLGIRERTVKAHVAKLMRKVGVENRVALTVHAITRAGPPAVKGAKLGGRRAGNRTRTFVGSNTPRTVSKCYSSARYSVAHWLGRCQGADRRSQGNWRDISSTGSPVRFLTLPFPGS